MELYEKKKIIKLEFFIIDYIKGVVLTVWEDDFDKIKIGEFYRFGNLFIRYYKKMVKFIIIKDIIIISIVNIQSLEEFENIGKIVGVFVEIDKKCKICYKVIVEFNFGKYFIKCFRCNWRQIIEFFLDDI